ncbi:MAG: class I SAM-dependent methyltransferase [Candidatus Zixiibacteriota bacterium]
MTDTHPEEKNEFEEHKTYFEEFFTITPFFKALTDERTTGEIQELVALCKFNQSDKILDLCCGQGRHSNKLRQFGFKAIGFDFSRTLLSIAQKNAADSDSGALFVRGNMKELPFQDAAFDWTLSLFGSFGFLSNADNEKTLAEVVRILKPGGRLLLEIQNKDSSMKWDGKESRHELESGGYLIQNSDFCPETRRMKIRRTFYRGDRKDEVSISYRLYTVPEISGLLASRGLEVLDVWGGLSGKTLDVDCRSMVVCSRKIL